MSARIGKDSLYSSGSDDIQEYIAWSLKRLRLFEDTLDSTELAVILSSVLSYMICQQRIMGQRVPISHSVRDMEVKFKKNGKLEMNVDALVGIESPIEATIRFAYALIDSQTKPGVLALKDDEVKVTETAGWLAIAALRSINVPKVALQELRDPNQVIRKSLPSELKKYGVDEQVDKVVLALATQALYVHLSLPEFGAA